MFPIYTVGTSSPVSEDILFNKLLSSEEKLKPVKDVLHERGKY
jgi:hypothetical protein